MDGSGNLYGTTSRGGAFFIDLPGNVDLGGTVFELTPPDNAGEKWTESILWNFGNGGDGTDSPVLA